MECTHDFYEIEGAIEHEDMCPLCLAAEVQRLTVELDAFKAVLAEERELRLAHQERLRRTLTDSTGGC